MKKKKSEGRNKFDLSQKRKKKKNNKMVSWLVLLIVALGGVVALTYVPFFNLHGVQITGTEGSEADKIKNLAAASLADKYYAVIPKSNIIVYPRDDIKKEILANFPSVKNATVKTSLEGQLLIQVEKREFKSIWCNPSKCYLVDQGGLIFAPAEGDELAGYLRLEGYLSGEPVGQTFGTPEIYNFFLNFSKQLADLGLRAERLKYYDQDKAEAVLEDGSSIYFLPIPRLANELNSNLAIFLNDLKAKNGGNLPAFQYIDARYGNKIFFKLK